MKALNSLITFFPLILVFTGIEPAANDDNDAIFTALKAGASKLQKKMQTLVDENLGYKILRVNNLLF